MSRHHAKRKMKRANLPKKKGKKRCPSCKNNTMVNGHCSSCNYGSPSMPDIDPEQIIAPIVVPVVASLVIKKKLKKENHEE